MGHPKRFVACLLTVLPLAAAGCAEPKPGVVALPEIDSEPFPGVDGAEAADGAGLTGLEQALGAVALNRTPLRTDWFVMATVGSPEASLAGFSWTIPEGSAVPDSFDPAFNVTALGIAPLIRSEDLPKLQQWVLAIFVLRDGTAEAWTTVARGQWQWAQQDPTGLFGGSGADEEDPDDWDNPLFAWIDYGNLAAGTNLGFVLGVRMSEPAEFGLALHVLDHDPQGVPPGDFTTFRLNLTSDPPLALPRLGSGQGLVYASYVDVNSLGTYAYEARTPAVEVRRTIPNAARPAVSIQDVLVTYAATFERGWTLGFGGYYPYAGAGRWGFDIDMHGTRTAGGGVLPPTLAILVPGAYPLIGLPYYAITSDGPGPASAGLAAQGASGPYVDLVFFDHLTFGATLSELVGLPCLPQTLLYPGALGAPDSSHGTRIIPRGWGVAVVSPDGVIRNYPAPPR